MINNAKGFFAPLIAFVSGFVLLAISTIFYPSIFNQASVASSAIGSAELSNYWGLGWGLSSIRFILFLIGLGCILFGVIFIWLKRKWRGW